jgi:hypothetical protein
VSACCYICVLVPQPRYTLKYMCPHTIVRVSSLLYVHSYYYICILRLLLCVLILMYVCPHASICVLILLYVSSYCYIHVSSYYYMCPRTTISICVFMHLSVSSYYCMCPHTTIYVSSCVKKDLLMNMCGIPGYCEKSVMSAPLSTFESSMASTCR